MKHEWMDFHHARNWKEVLLSADLLKWEQFSFPLKMRTNNYYPIFSIKRRGRLFKTRPRRPGVYSNPVLFIRGPAFIY